MGLFSKHEQPKQDSEVKPTRTDGSDRLVEKDLGAEYMEDGIPMGVHAYFCDICGGPMKWPCKHMHVYM